MNRNDLTMTILTGTTLLLVSCSGMQGPLTTAATTGAGAAIGNSLDDGGGGGTVLGAIAGYAGGVALDNAGKKSQKEHYATGYDKGRSDSTKLLYWAQRDAHARKAGESNLEKRFYEIPVPAHITGDGVLVEPHNRVIEVVE